MEEVKNKQEIKKTQVFNVIILDRSGSMECIRQAAVEGFNETLTEGSGEVCRDTRPFCDIGHIL